MRPRRSSRASQEFVRFLLASCLLDSLAAHVPGALAHRDRDVWLSEIRARQPLCDGPWDDRLEEVAEDRCLEALESMTLRPPQAKTPWPKRLDARGVSSRLPLIPSSSSAIPAR